MADVVHTYWTKHKDKLFFSLYLVFLLLNVIFHEPWRDEFHSWNIARVSDSLVELMRNKAYEGHPGLWYLLCWGLTRLTAAPEALAVMHAAIVAVGAWLLYRHAPFSSLQKLLVLLGYFPLYEYGTLARNYAILILLLWGYCALRNRSDGYWKQLLLLGLMLFTQIYGLLLASAFFLEWLWHHQKEAKGKMALAMLLFASTFLLALMDIVPPADVTAHARWYTDFSWESISYALSVLWDAFLPIPQMQFHFWNTNFLTLAPEQLSLTTKALGGIVIWLILTFGLLRTPTYRLLFLLGTLACLAFVFARFHGYMRHHGQLVILFVGVLWLEQQRRKFSFSGWRKGLLYALLAIHLLAGIYASVRDWRDVFSPVKEVARYIELLEKQAPHDIWIADPDYLIEPVGAILQHPLYFPKQEKQAYFPQWDKDWGYISPEEVLLKSQLLAAEAPVLLILGYEMTAMSDAAFQLKLLRQFGPGIEASERFWVYELRKSHGLF